MAYRPDSYSKHRGGSNGCLLFSVRKQKEISGTSEAGMTQDRITTRVKRGYHRDRVLYGDGHLPEWG